MELTEKEAQAFWPVYESYQKDLGLLNGRMLVLLDDFSKSFQAMTGAIHKGLPPVSEPGRLFALAALYFLHAARCGDRS